MQIYYDKDAKLDLLKYLLDQPEACSLRLDSQPDRYWMVRLASAMDNVVLPTPPFRFTTANTRIPHLLLQIP